MDQTRPMEAGKEVKCSKGKRGRREAGQVMIPLRLMAPGGPADTMHIYTCLCLATQTLALTKDARVGCEA